MNEENLLTTMLVNVQSQMRENNLEGFKVHIDNLIKNAVKTLEDTQVEWEFEHDARKLKEKFCLLHNYLDYLKRLCKPH